MASNSESEQILEMAIAGISRVAQAIAAMPAEDMREHWRLRNAVIGKLRENSVMGKLRRKPSYFKTSPQNRQSHVPKEFAFIKTGPLNNSNPGRLLGNGPVSPR